MGNLLKLLSKDYTPTKVDIFVDFENAQATEHEFPLYTKVEEVLKDACHILEELQQYRGASSEIREVVYCAKIRYKAIRQWPNTAISNPSNDDLQEKAWEAVRPLVLQLKRYYEFSIQLENIVPQLLGKLCSNDKTAKEHLETQQALFKQFAQILDFTLKFDDLKMNNPAIQNDFSYYRRTLSRMKMTNEHSSNMDNQEVSNEIANRMSLFYAHATPMLKTLSDTTTKFVSENKDIPVENTTDCLSTMASICRVMIENPDYYTRFQNEETLLFCMRVMVGVIILYDHVHPVGAFAKNSHIDVKSSIKVLKDQHPVNLEALLNALRYTTKHLNDDATPKGTKTLLA